MPAAEKRPAVAAATFPCVDPSVVVISRAAADDDNSVQPLYFVVIGADVIAQHGIAAVSP
jgi:hypothetical protein